MFIELIKSYRVLPVLLCATAMTFSPLSAQEAEIKQSPPVQEQTQEVPEEQSQQTESEATIQENAPKVGPALRKLEEYTASLLTGLEPAQAQYIYKIRQEFGVIRSIQVARKDIEKAVGSCGDRNPEMKEDISARFNGWKEAVLPKLNTADEALKDAIQRQGFRPTVRVTMLLDHVQSAFEERDAQIERVPVTTKDACETLLKSLDQTQKSLAELMDQTTETLNKMSTEPDETAAIPE